MSRLQETFDYFHGIVGDEYPTGMCYGIARELFRAARLGGEQARVANIQGPHEDDRTALIVPKIYEGRVTWTTHFACWLPNDIIGMVYDPILEQPVDTRTYLEETFTTPVFVTQDLIPRL